MYGNSQRRKKQITYGKTTRNSTFSSQRVGSFFEEPHPSDRIEHKSSLPKLPRATVSKRDALPPKRATLQSAPARDEFDVPSSDDDRTSKPASVKSKTTPLKNYATATTTRTTRQNKRPLDPDMHSAAASPSQVRDTPRKRSKTASPQPPSLIAVGTSPKKSLQKPAIEMSAQRRTAAIPLSSLKGTSAPARLTELLPIIPDLLNDSFSSPPSTPPAALTPHRTLNRSVSTTPKQSYLWEQLLPPDTAEKHSASTNVVPGSSQTRRSKRAPGIIDEAIVHLPHARIERRPRLVDRLKQDARIFGAITADDNDTVADEADATAGTTPRVNVSFSQSEATPTQLFQNADSQSQQTSGPAGTSQTLSGLKSTYSRTRSYLQEDDLEDSLLLAMPTTTPNRPVPEVRRGGAAHVVKPKSLFDQDDESDEGSSKGIRSIHELRAAGSKKRFNDDNQALLDDIKDHRQSARSRRRSALMELASKFGDKTFVGRFVELGFDREFAAEFSSSGLDPIADTIICAALMRMLGSDSIERSVPRLNDAGALKFFADRLNNDKGIAQLAKDRHSNMSKAAQSTLLGLAESLRACPVWDECPPETLSTRLLALKCMDLMILKLRRQGIYTPVLNLETITVLVDITTGSLAPANTSSGPNSHTVTTRLSLAVLEGASAMVISGNSVNNWSTQLLLQLATALPLILAVSNISRTMYLRLCLNLTNNQAANCALFSDEHIVQALVGDIVGGFVKLHVAPGEQEALLDLDDLLLSLGLMINLAEFSDEVCETVAALPENGLLALVKNFLQGQDKAEEAESMEQSHGNVAHGYLAVLLGNLCQNKSTRAQVTSILPGQKLELLITAVEEFVHYHKKVDSQTFEGEEGQDVWTHFTDRLMAVVARLRSRDQ